MECADIMKFRILNRYVIIMLKVALIGCSGIGR